MGVGDRDLHDLVHVRNLEGLERSQGCNPRVGRRVAPKLSQEQRRSPLDVEVPGRLGQSDPHLGCAIGPPAPA